MSLDVRPNVWPVAYHLWMSIATSPDLSLPVADFDARDFPLPERFDVFHDGAAPIFDARSLIDPTGFHSVTRDYFIDSVLVSRLQNDPYLVQRDQRHLSDGSTDWVTIQLFIAGGARGVVQGGRNLRLDDRTVGVVDLARPYTASTSRSDLIAVCIPRDRIEAADTLYRTTPSVAWPADSEHGRMLTTAVRELWRSLGQARLEDGPGLADDIIDTLNRALRPGELSVQVRDVRTQADRFIEANLAEQDLDARTVGAAIGYSRSAVYRLYEPDGGVRRYVRSRRLRRCLDELARPTDPARRVVAVAARWGFEDASHFNRLFRAEFGVPPSAVRPPGSEAYEEREWPSSMTDDLHRLHAWQRSA